MPLFKEGSCSGPAADPPGSASFCATHLQLHQGSCSQLQTPASKHSCSSCPCSCGAHHCLMVRFDEILDKSPVCMATQAQRGTSSLQRQAKTYGPQLLLSLLWILALTHAFKTDPQGFTAVCSVSSLPTLASIAAHTRAARAVRRAAAAAASHVLAAPAASLPPLLKLACAHATACLATMCKWLERPRSANSSVSLRLSSSGRQAMQSCAAHSKSTVTIVTSLVYISLSCGLMASVMTLPGLILDRCAMLLVQCWPCLLVLLAYKVTIICCIRFSICQTLNDVLPQCIVVCMLRCALLHALTPTVVCGMCLAHECYISNCCDVLCCMH